jgi:hypothetical protein
MYEHLGMWTRDLGASPARLDLWDTGRTDSYGKSELRYALWIGSPESDRRGVLIEGEDFHPSPLTAIDSDESAGALLGFFTYYGEAIQYSGDDADVPEDLTAAQREAITAHHDELSLWAFELEGEDESRTGTLPSGGDCARPLRVQSQAHRDACTRLE